MIYEEVPEVIPVGEIWAVISTLSQQLLSILFETLLVQFVTVIWDLFVEFNVVGGVVDNPTAWMLMLIIIGTGGYIAAKNY